MQHSAFYRFTRIADPGAFAERVRTLAGAQGLCGVVLLAAEGINGTLAGDAPALGAFEAALQSDAAFGGQFFQLRFQRTTCTGAPFKRLKVHVRRAIVDIGRSLQNDSYDKSPAIQGAIAPADWDALIARDDVVLLDNRNQFEFQLGHFAGALDAQVSHYRDFSEFVSAHLGQWQQAGKTIAMYCTGGIRCEKTSAWLSEQNVPSFQLDGGILNYLREKAQQSVPAQPSSWQGGCFVFDNRMALDAQLNTLPVTPEQVYTAPRDAWRLARALRLQEADD